MKKHFFTASLIAAALAVLPAGCAGSTPLPAENTALMPEKLKVGYYVDDGSRSNGAFYWAQLLFYSPQLEVTLLDAEDIRNGQLDKLDLLVIPGGSSASQVFLLISFISSIDNSRATIILFAPILYHALADA